MKFRSIWSAALAVSLGFTTLDIAAAPATDPNVAAEVDPTEAKLNDARRQYNATMDAAKAELSKLLQKAEEQARMKGDLKLLDQVLAEAAEFEKSGKLPTSVDSKGFAGKMNRAHIKLKQVYEDAVKTYTRRGEVELARAVQKELSEFTPLGAKSAAKTSDGVEAGSIWNSDPPKSKLIILAREGESFRARFEVGANIVREVSGTISDGKIGWESKNVKALKGKAGGDNFGRIDGDKMHFEWREANGSGGTFLLVKQQTK